MAKYLPLRLSTSILEFNFVNIVFDLLECICYCLSKQVFMFVGHWAWLYFCAGLKARSMQFNALLSRWFCPSQNFLCRAAVTSVGPVFSGRVAVAAGGGAVNAASARAQWPNAEQNLVDSLRCTNWMIVFPTPRDPLLSKDTMKPLPYQTKFV